MAKYYIVHHNKDDDNKRKEEENNYKKQIKDLYYSLKERIEEWYNKNETRILKIGIHICFYTLLIVNLFDFKINLPEFKLPEIKKQVSTFAYEDLTQLYDKTNAVRKETNYISLHHSASENNTVEDVYNYHKNVKGWSSIAYHFVIKGKNVYKCHSLEKCTGGTSGHSKDCIDVCLIGDFSKRSPTDEEINTLIETLTFIKKAYKKPKILPHRELGLKPTECCGDSLWFNPKLQEFLKTI